MPGMPWPQDSDEATFVWDHCSLAGELLPGLCSVKVTGGIDIDKGKAANTHGATLKLKGTKPRAVTITWKVWNPPDLGDQEESETDQWDRMQDKIAEFESVRGKKDLTPLVIFHPTTFVRQVNAIVIEDIDGPDWQAGYMVCVLKCIEANPPTQGKGLGTATGSKAGSPGSEWEQAPTKEGKITVGSTGPDGKLVTKEVDKKAVQTDANKQKPSKTATSSEDD